MCAAFIDVSKAFDKVCFKKLIDVLISLGFSIELVSFIRNWHYKQNVCVKNQNAHSTSWKLANGVRQGSMSYE